MGDVGSSAWGLQRPSFLALLASLILGDWFESTRTRLHPKRLSVKLAVKSPSPSSSVEDPPSVNVGPAETTPIYYTGSGWGIEEDTSFLWRHAHMLCPCPVP